MALGVLGDLEVLAPAEYGGLGRGPGDGGLGAHRLLSHAIPMLSNATGQAARSFSPPLAPLVMLSPYPFRTMLHPCVNPVLVALANMTVSVS